MGNTAALQALLGGGQPDQQQQDAPNPLEALQSCIQDLHGLMAVMPDAQHTALIHQAMAPLLKIQAELSQAGQQTNPRQQLLQQLSGQ